jgi:hypothetical protein
VDKPKDCVALPKGEAVLFVNGDGEGTPAPNGDGLAVAEDPKGLVLPLPPNGEKFCVENDV